MRNRIRSNYSNAVVIGAMGAAGAAAVRSARKKKAKTPAAVPAGEDDVAQSEGEDPAAAQPEGIPTEITPYMGMEEAARAPNRLVRWLENLSKPGHKQRK